jgi:serine/threonine protein kinase
VKEVNFDLISASFEEVQREILLLRSLRHENIIEYYTSFSHTVEDEEGNEVLLIWLVMQLMEYGAS